MSIDYNNYKNDIVILNNCGTEYSEMFNIDLGCLDSLCLIPLSYSMKDRGDNDTYTWQVLCDYLYLHILRSTDNQVIQN